MPRRREPGKALGVVLNQVARTRPLKPPNRLPRRLRRPRHLPALQTTRDRRVSHPEFRSDQPWAPTRPGSGFADPVMNELADPARLPNRCRGPVCGPRARRPISIAGLSVAIDPELHRRNADSAPIGGLSTRKTFNKAFLDQLNTLPTGQPPTLVLHPG